MRNNQFKTKEEYLQYRKDWKAEYKLISQAIRDKKWLRKEYCRAFNQTMNLHGHPWNGVYNESQRDAFVEDLNHDLKENKRYQELKDKWKDCLESYREDATAMLEELKLAKQEARRQYLASKEQLVTA